MIICYFRDFYKIDLNRNENLNRACNFNYKK